MFTSDNPPVYRTPSGYRQDCTSHSMEWDSKGKYIGQWQANAMDDGPNEIFLWATKEQAEFDLTEVQMKEAFADSSVQVA